MLLQLQWKLGGQVQQFQWKVAVGGRRLSGLWTLEALTIYVYVAHQSEVGDRSLRVAEPGCSI
jgi:hypothetical protein